MERLQWGKFAALLGVAALLFGLGFLMQHWLPEFLPLLQANSWQWIAKVIYNLGQILFIIFLIIFAIIVITTFKSRSKKKVDIKADDQMYEKEANDLIEALGGATNIESVDSCLSRVRINIANIDAINQTKIQDLGSSGIFMSGSQVQAIFGEESQFIQSQLKKILHERKK